MRDTTHSIFHVREEKIKALQHFGNNLLAAMRHCDNGDGENIGKARTAISGECVACKTEISGDELLAIGDSSEANGKVKRMRLGYCAQAGCESFNYRIHFYNIEGLDWKPILDHLEMLAEARSKAVEAEAAAKKHAWYAINWRLTGRIAIGLGIVLLLLGLRQWYYGGTIPLIREPEKFRIGTLPSGQTESHR